MTQGLARFESEIFCEGPSQFAERAQCVGLTVATVEGEHLLCPQAFSERVGGHQRVEFRDEAVVEAEGELTLDACLVGTQAQFVEAGDLRSGKRRKGKVDERGTPPESERAAQMGRRAPMIERRSRRGTLDHERFEAQRVHRIRIDGEQVARLAVDHTTRGAPEVRFGVGSRAGFRVRLDVRLHQATQHGDVAMEGGRRASGHRFPPQTVDESIRGKHSIGLQGEHCEQGADLCPGHDYCRTGDDHFQAAEHPHLDATRRERRGHLAPLLPSLHRLRLPPGQILALRPILADVVPVGVYIREMRSIATIGLG